MALPRKGFHHIRRFLLNMAQRRMFSLQIVDTDAFLDMPQSSQLLYFHLSMRADDEGFVSNPKKVMKIIGSQDDDIKVLFAKRFVLPFESGVCVIKHWKIHNYIQNDRFTPTQWVKEKEMLKIDEKTKKYQLKSGDVSKMDTQVRLEVGKGRIGKSSPEKSGVKDVVNYFFELKGWANKEKSFYKENDIRYAHHAKRAKELLELCEGDVYEAKECIRKMSEWASSKNLTWMIETVFKHWYDIDSLKPAEKKPYFENCRIFQKTQGGRWWIIRNGEIKELGILPRKDQIVYK